MPLNHILNLGLFNYFCVWDRERSPSLSQFLIITKGKANNRTKKKKPKAKRECALGYFFIFHHVLFPFYLAQSGLIYSKYFDLFISPLFYSSGNLVYVFHVTFCNFYCLVFNVVYKLGPHIHTSSSFLVHILQILFLCFFYETWRSRTTNGYTLVNLVSLVLLDSTNEMLNKIFLSPYS